jgi:hypothetical protein
MIGGWLAPKNTVEAYKLAKECGINAMYLLGSDCGFCGDDGQIEAVKVAQAVGVNAIPLVTHRRMTFKDERLLQFDNVPAIMLSDEPSSDRYPHLEECIKEFYEMYPTSMRCEINLLPNYATLDQLKTKDYFEYVEKYVEMHERVMPKGNVLSVDHYPIFKKDEGIVITPLWLRCLSTLTYFSRRKDLPTHCFIQTMAFGKPNDVAQDFALLRMQFMVYFAFGFRAFSHFCYASPGIDALFLEHQEAIIGRNGLPTKLYDEVKKVNGLVQSFANSYLDYRHLGTVAIAPEGQSVEAFEKWAEYLDLADTNIAEVTTDCPLLVGKFRNEKNEEALFVTHYNLPDKGVGCVTLRLKEKRNATLQKDGETQTVLSSDCLQIDLEAGNGVFIRLQ